ncbi:MAG: 50S ribosomal protein L9 [Nevskia sp.]|jgi:large subunit ribosomal protein L9|nr:50S ribosomal protein L9 [Nevskia sp.]MCK9385917.1 50S ribosomal protein L9 [Nevskia sp.]
MELILLEKVTNLGDLGDVVNVKPGYGRNFLLPQGKALTATTGNKEVFETRKAELMKKYADSLNAAKMRAEKLAGKHVTIKALTAEEGRLYGSVGPADVARAAEAAGLGLEKSEIDMPEGPIRVVGTYTVAVRLHSEVESSLIVVVEQEKA